MSDDLMNIDDEDLQEQIDLRRRRRRPLQRQSALMGMSTPPEIIIQIEDLSREINFLQRRLQASADGQPPDAGEKRGIAAPGQSGNASTTIIHNYIGGDQISGDKVGGDKVGGDRVGGDKVGGDKVSGDRVGGDKSTAGDKHYEDMIVEVSDAQLIRTEDKRRLVRFNVRVLSSPAGEMRPDQAVAIEYDNRQLQSRLRQLEVRALDVPGMIALGRDLAQLLLPPKLAGAATGLRDLFTASLAQIGQDRGLRLRLRLPPLLAVLPWEYLYLDRAGGGEGMDGFLALDPRIAIVRHESLPTPAPLPLASGPLKIVVALASPEGLPELDLAKEQADLRRSFDGQASITPVFLEDATLDEVLGAIPGAGVFHFAGHGVFAQQMGDLPGTYTGSGALALDDGRVEAERLGINLRGNGVRLAVLGGCETGRRDGVSVWSGIAPALVKAEVPAVVANQFPIIDACAIAFSKHFYQALVGGLPIERAVSAGRIAAYNADPQGRDWGVAVLYLRAANGYLFGGAADAGVRERAAASAQATVQPMVDAKLYIAGSVNTGGGDFVAGNKIVHGD